jgi:hypothetical protein
MHRPAGLMYGMNFSPVLRHFFSVAGLQGIRAAAALVSRLYSWAGRLIGVIILCPYDLFDC